MNNKNLKNEKEGGLSVAKKVWATLIIGMGSWVFVISVNHGAPVTVDFETAPWIYLFLAGISALVISFISFKVLSKSISSSNSFKEACERFFVPFVIRAVLISFCPIMGMVASFRYEQNLMHIFIIPALICMALTFPTEKRVRSMVKRKGLKKLT